MSSTPIADYALLSDRHSAALVNRDGSVDWLCFPRFDSPSIFGRLLGDDAGHWSIGAKAATQVTRRYLDRTMVLETTFRTPDWCGHTHRRPGHGRRQPGHQLGKDAPHLLLRGATCIDGDVDLSWNTSCAPSTGGSIHASMPSKVGWLPLWGADELVLSSPIPLTLNKSAASGRAPPPPRRDVRTSPCTTEKRAESRPKQGLESIRDRHAARRHRLGVGVVVRTPPGLRRPMEGPGATQRAGAAVALLCADWGDLRGGNHVAARGGGRQPQLGLPLRMGSGRFLHDSGSLGGGLP